MFALMARFFSSFTRSKNACSNSASFVLFELFAENKRRNYREWVLFCYFSDDVGYRYPSLVHVDSETHGGDDVMVFARGPWAHLFTGNFEQNEIPLAMAMAAGISTEAPGPSGKSGAARFDSIGLNAFLATAFVGLMRIF